MFLVHVNVCDFADTMLIVVQINLILIWFVYLSGERIEAKCSYLNPLA